MKVVIDTSRLELQAGTAEMVRAEADDPQRLAQAINARVPSEWPPPFNDEESMRFLLRFFAENPDAVGWGHWYFILKEVGDRVVIGNGGFKGTPDQTGHVEIGYSLLPQYQGKGYGTEAVRGLLSWAFSHPEITGIIAETFPELKPSIRVLEKNRFVNVGKGSEQGTLRFVLTREAFQKDGTALIW